MNSPAVMTLPMGGTTTDSGKPPRCVSLLRSLERRSVGQALVATLPVLPVAGNVAIMRKRDRLGGVFETPRPIGESFGTEPAQRQ